MTLRIRRQLVVVDWDPRPVRSKKCCQVVAQNGKKKKFFDQWEQASPPTQVSGHSLGTLHGTLHVLHGTLHGFPYKFTTLAPAGWGSRPARARSARLRPARAWSVHGADT